MKKEITKIKTVGKEIVRVTARPQGRMLDPESILSARAAHCPQDREKLDKALLKVLYFYPGLDESYTSLRRGTTEKKDRIIRLLKTGADVEAKNENGMTPLMKVVSESCSLKKKMWRRYDKYYESDHSTLKYSRAPLALNYSYREPSYGRFKHSEEYGQKRIKREIELVGILLDAGADIEARYEDGDTLFMRAVKRGSVELVRFLLERGADPSVKDSEGRTALSIATEKRDASKETVEMTRYIWMRYDHNRDYIDGNFLEMVELLESLGTKE